MLNRYVKKPIVIEAIQWLGSNTAEIDAFLSVGLDPAVRAIDSEYHVAGEQLMIYTLEGNHLATVGDFIIRGIQGEFYPCKPDIFFATYDAVTEA